MNNNNEKPVFGHDEMAALTGQDNTARIDDSTIDITEAMNEAEEMPASPTRSRHGRRVGIAAGGVALGGAAIYAATRESTPSPYVTDLAQGAIPDPDDDTTGSSADIMIDDQFDLPNSLSESARTGHSAYDDLSVEVYTPAPRHTSSSTHSHHHHRTQAAPEPDHIVDHNETSSAPDQPVADTGDTDIAVAQVDDSMTFGEAFAAARQQVGSAGCFEWHGRTYTTFYAEEWDSLSDDERAGFLSTLDSARHDEITPEAVETTDDTPIEMEIISDDVPVEITDDMPVDMASDMPVDMTDHTDTGLSMDLTDHGLDMNDTPMDDLMSI